MNFDNVCFAVVCITICCSMIGFSSPSSMEKDGTTFNPKNCTEDDDCANVCIKGENLYSRCDPNGNCICDCSDEDSITSSYASACAGPQPDGQWRDYCDKYCTQEYLRPCRYCNDSRGNFYCTCVCNLNPTPTH